MHLLFHLLRELDGNLILDRLSPQDLTHLTQVFPQLMPTIQSHAYTRPVVLKMSRLFECRAILKTLPRLRWPVIALDDRSAATNTNLNSFLSLLSETWKNDTRRSGRRVWRLTIIVSAPLRRQKMAAFWSRLPPLENCHSLDVIERIAPMDHKAILEGHHLDLECMAMDHYYSAILGTLPNVRDIRYDLNRTKMSLLGIRHPEKIRSLVLLTNEFHNRATSLYLTEASQYILMSMTGLRELITDLDLYIANDFDTNPLPHNGRAINEGDDRGPRGMGPPAAAEVAEELSDYEEYEEVEEDDENAEPPPPPPPIIPVPREPPIPLVPVNRNIPQERRSPLLDPEDRPIDFGDESYWLRDKNMEEKYTYKVPFDPAQKWSSTLEVCRLKAHTSQLKRRILMSCDRLTDMTVTLGDGFRHLDSRRNFVNYARLRSLQLLNPTYTALMCTFRKCPHLESLSLNLVPQTTDDLIHSMGHILKTSPLTFQWPSRLETFNVFLSVDHTLVFGLAIQFMTQILYHSKMSLKHLSLDIEPSAGQRSLLMEGNQLQRALFNPFSEKLPSGLMTVKLNYTALIQLDVIYLVCKILRLPKLKVITVDLMRELELIAEVQSEPTPRGLPENHNPNEQEPLHDVHTNALIAAMGRNLLDLIRLFAIYRMSSSSDLHGAERTAPSKSEPYIRLQVHNIFSREWTHVYEEQVQNLITYLNNQKSIPNGKEIHIQGPIETNRMTAKVDRDTNREYAENERRATRTSSSSKLTTYSYYRVDVL